MQDNQNSRVEEARFVSPSDLSVNFTKKQMVFLGLQNTVAMSGVIIVPILCGLNVSVTLFCAGIGTLIYQFIDKGIVPAFLGGSFAFIAPLTMIITDMGIPYAQGGLVFVMCFYFLFALLLKLLGTERINRVFPPVITDRKSTRLNSSHRT